MVDYGYTAGHAIAAYVWNLVKNELGWSESNYGGLVPVVPVQQQPELNSASGPFIVFGSAIDPVSTMWLIDSETVALTIYSQKISDINKVTGLVVDKLKRYDESAQIVNDFIYTLNSGHPAKAFDFKTIRVVGASGPQPSLQVEGGRHDGNIIIKAQYTKDFN